MKSGNQYEILAPLFPETVVTVFSDCLPADIELPPEEASLTKSMAEKRYRDFAHGRHCAREALRRRGEEAATIGKGEHREPLWPEGICGSISHTGDFAAAAVTTSSDLRTLGLDLEHTKPLELKLLKAICRPEEMARFPSDEVAGIEGKLLFSIKESIYKCLWPLVRCFIDFTEMEVRLNPETCTYIAISHTDKCSADLIRQLQGRYMEKSGLVCTSAWIK
jgi:4'-phosphopantetheinyl transferase EntD